MIILPPPLPDIILDPIVRLALAEDLGRAGDLTTDATIAPGTQPTPRRAYEMFIKLSRWPIATSAQ